MSSNRNSLFWKMYRGEAKPPTINNTLQARYIDIDPDNKQLTIGFVAGDDFLNASGKVHNGALSAMLNAAMGQGAGMILGDNEYAPTLDLKINFIQSAPPGNFIGKSIINSLTDNVCYAFGELYDETGNLIATATSTALIIQFKK